MISKTFDLGSKPPYKYVVVLSRYQSKILLSRHRNRDTWETQGGHIEPGESPEVAARRELFEESGAVDFDLKPLCDYWVWDGYHDSSAGGVVFTAEIRQLGPLPDREMAEVGCFDALPDNLTYPEITPVLFERWGVK